jgi:mono/diheme cytochrome c family protein
MTLAPRSATLATVCLLLAAGCGLKQPDWQTAPVPAAAPDPAAVARGRYIFDAANCTGCHTDAKHGGARLAGGRAIETPFGVYYSRNITPDPDFGIGRWSDADFLTALRDGLSPTGAHYFPVFPFPAFTFMTDRDILDLKAYLFAQPPQRVANKPHDVSFPFDMRLTMVLWRALYFTPSPYKPDPNHDAQWNRGAYLVRAVAHCGECHTPRDSMGGLVADRMLGGARLAGGDRKLAPNITSDPKDGIGRWSAGDIASFLKFGIRPNGDVAAAPMSEVIEGTAKLTDADRQAIADYLKSMPPLPGHGG